jgi:hypothetical protein
VPADRPVARRGPGPRAGRGRALPGRAGRRGLPGRPVRGRDPVSRPVLLAAATQHPRTAAGHRRAPAGRRRAGGRAAAGPPVARCRRFAAVAHRDEQTERSLAAALRLAVFPMDPVFAMDGPGRLAPGQRGGGRGCPVDLGQAAADWRRPRPPGLASPAPPGRVGARAPGPAPRPRRRHGTSSGRAGGPSGAAGPPSRRMWPWRSRRRGGRRPCWR